MTGKTIKEIAGEANNQLYDYLYNFYLDQPDSASCEIEKDGYLIQIEIGRRYKMVRAFDRNDKDDWPTANKIKEYVREYDDIRNEAREQRMQEAEDRSSCDRQEIEYWKLQRL